MLYFNLYLVLKKKIVDFIVRNYIKICNLIFFKYEGTWLVTLIVWLKKNQKLAAFTSSFIMTIQVIIIRDDNENIQSENLKIEKLNSTLTSALLSQNSDMDNYPFPWWRKQKSGRYYIFLDLNDSYEEQLKIKKLSVLGKSNFQVMPIRSAQIFHDNDSILAYSLTDTLIVEPFEFQNGTIMKVIVWKGARRERLDTILEGFAIPLEKILKVIEDNK